MRRSRFLAIAATTAALLAGSVAVSATAQAAGRQGSTAAGSAVSTSSGTSGTSTSTPAPTSTTFPTPPTFPTFPLPPTFPTFPTFPTQPTFPTFPPPAPAPTPVDPGTNGTKSIVAQLAPGGGDNDGNFDINQFDYHITALLVHEVLAADPSGPLAVLADGTRRATFFEPSDGEWVGLARKLSGQALPLPSAATEQATYTFLRGLGIGRIERILSYDIVPGTTLTSALLGPPTISSATYTTANGESLLVKSNFGVITLVDNSPLTANSGIVEAAMNAGNRQIAWSTAVLLPSTF